MGGVKNAPPSLVLFSNEYNDQLFHLIIRCFQFLMCLGRKCCIYIPVERNEVKTGQISRTRPHCKISCSEMVQSPDSLTHLQLHEENGSFPEASQLLFYYQ